MPLKLVQAIALAKGAATYVPFVHSVFGQRRMTPAGITAKYCYGVWFKHLTLLDDLTGCGVPDVVAELGPGDAVGVGIAALLTGASRYIGIDARPYAVGGPSHAIAADLVEMFRQKLPFTPSGWPEFGYLLERGFLPSRLLGDERRVDLLSEARVREVLTAADRVARGASSPLIAYRAPLSDPAFVGENSVDLVLSHSVLEHVVDLPQTIRNTFELLRPGGYASHLFDLTSHNIVGAWDGHRAFGEKTWKVVVGKRPFMINRLPYSAILRTIRDSGFRILKQERLCQRRVLTTAEVGEAWRESTEEDLNTSGGFIVAQKPPS